jgi:hypothetical protein
LVLQAVASAVQHYFAVSQMQLLGIHKYIQCHAASHCNP